MDDQKTPSGFLMKLMSERKLTPAELSRAVGIEESRLRSIVVDLQVLDRGVVSAFNHLGVGDYLLMLDVKRLSQENRAALDYIESTCSMLERIARGLRGSEGVLDGYSKTSAAVGIEDELQRMAMRKIEAEQARKKRLEAYLALG